MSAQARAKAAAPSHKQALSSAPQRRGFTSIDAAEDIFALDADSAVDRRPAERSARANEPTARTALSAAAGAAPHRPMVVRKRRDEPDTAADGAPAHVRDVMDAPGETLEPATRRLMESRFGHDFGRVRVHTDARAAASVQAVNATAYTVGRHIAFASGRYSPRTRLGRYLLAHELTHVAQQSSGREADAERSPHAENDRGEEEANQNAAAILGATSARGISISPQPVSLQRSSGIPILGPIIDWLGKALFEGTFSDETLLEYLKGITASNRIEDRIDSDNKARAVVLRWKAANAKFDLSASQKTLLVLEMLSGDTQEDDQERILDLLELSNNPDLKQMFLGGGLSVKRLEEKLDDPRRERLEAFFSTRFEGGRKALLDGDVELRGGAGKGAPRFPGSLKAKLETYSVDELIEEISGYDSANRDRALHDLGLVRTELSRRVDELADQLEGAAPDKQAGLTKQKDALSKQQTKLELVMEHVFADIARAESASTLPAKTVEPGVREKAEILEAIAPEVRKDKSGKSLEFQNTLVGEKMSYEAELRAALPRIVQDTYAMLVVGRGKKEHSDASKLYSPDDIENIGKASRDETNTVFGAYQTGPELTVDRPGTKGVIHDLFARAEEEQSSKNFDRRERAEELVFYIFQTHPDIRKLNRRHNASPKFDKDDHPLNAEAIAQETVAKQYLRDDGNIRRLNEINRDWPAAEKPTIEGGTTRVTVDVRVQFFKPVGATAEIDRKFRWQTFQSLVHEYLHTLVHRTYFDYARTFGDNSPPFNTLMEGVDSLLTETVWSNVYGRINDRALRLRVEGPKYSRELPPPSLEPRALKRYPSFTEAVKLVNVVGVRNLYAAYFLGDLKKIGAEPPRKPVGADGGARAPVIIHDVMQTPGQPLDGATRKVMEARLGRSFGDVRVHADTAAARSATDARAQAYTVAPHVVFGAGRYAPDTVEGRRLLAHELTHVVQQSAATGRNDPDRATEDEADRIGAAVAAGGSSTVRLAKARGALQRQEEPDPAPAGNRDTAKILRAATRARQGPQDATSLTIRGSEIVYRLVDMYLPGYAGLLSGVGFDPRVRGVRARVEGRNISISVGSDFIMNTTERTMLSRAIELRDALARTGMAPVPQAKSAPKQAMTRAEFDLIMADRYRVERVRTGVSEDQYLGKEKRTDWKEWDPGASSEVYNWIVQAFVDLEKTFGGVPAVKEIVFFRMDYRKEGDKAVEDTRTGASYSAGTLRIYRAVQTSNKMFDLHEAFEPPTPEQAVRRNITHELGHGIIETTKTQTTDQPPGADPQMLEEYSKTVGWVKVGGVDQLYDIQQPAVQQALRQGKTPPDQFHITPKSLDFKSWKELPLTKYMADSPQEDFAEAIMAYVNEPERLKLHSPARYAFIDRRKEKWIASGQPKMNIWERASRGIPAPRTLQPSRGASER